MATKKKAKSTAKKSAKIATGKKNSKTAVLQKNTKAGKSKKSSSKTKATAKRKTKKPAFRQPVVPIVTSGPDLHLIPVTGEIHPARKEEASQFEKVFKHNEEIALHREQERAKQILASTRGGGGKRIFKNSRQS